MIVVVSEEEEDSQLLDQKDEMNIKQTTQRCIA